MALNDTFTIQEINLDKKNISYENKLKEIEEKVKKGEINPFKAATKLFNYES